MSKRIGILSAIVLVLAQHYGAAASSWPENPNWQQYVLATGASLLTPARIVSVSGKVSNPAGLLDGTGGGAKFSWDGRGPAPAILVDYGIESGGVPLITVTATSGRLFAPVVVRVAFAETQQFMTVTGDYSTFEDIHVNWNGNHQGSKTFGGFRFQLIRLQNAGTVTLTGIGVAPRYEHEGAPAYQGWFLSSDTTLNKIWYAGAYTVQTNTLPENENGNSVPWLVDGAKRDRALWSGDLFVSGRTLMLSLGQYGLPYVQGSLITLAANQGAEGWMPGVVGFFGPWAFFYSATYSMYYALSLVDYFRYTGDESFVSGQYANFIRQLAFNDSLVNPATGLLSIPGDGEMGNDWDYYDGSKIGEIAAYNMLYYRVLTDAVYLAQHLGHADDAQRWTDQAAALRAKINEAFFDSTRGVYRLATRDFVSGEFHPAYSVPQDANAMAVLWGVADANRAQSALRYLKTNLWISTGTQPFSPDANYSNRMSPFITGYEVNARFAADDAANALQLTRLLWGRMVNSDLPSYTGTLWENVAPEGTVSSGTTSLSHGWASGPTGALSNYVLGIEPVTPGFAMWLVRPQTGELAWAQGQVPTPVGALVVRWAQDESTRQITLQVEPPSGTTGTVAVPAALGVPVFMDGVHVWDGTGPQGGGSAFRVGAYVYIPGISGTHTFRTVSSK